MDFADAVVIGSGPNGLAAAAYLGRAGWKVTVLERSEVPGGAVRSEELTEPGYTHDTFSAFYGLLRATPVFAELGLDRGVEWAQFDMPVSTLTTPKEAGLLYSKPEETARSLSEIDANDGRAWRDLYAWWLRSGRQFFAAVTAPIPPIMEGLRFLRTSGIGGSIETAKRSLQPMEALAERLFSSDTARALLASGVSHADLAVDEAGSTPGALILAMVAQENGMPVPIGGAGRLAEAMTAAVKDAGVTVECGRDVTKVIVEGGRAVGVETAQGDSIRARRAVLADTGPLALFRDLAGEDTVPKSYLEGLRRFRYGSGVFKIDLALNGLVPWSLEELSACGVVHVTGGLENMARAAHGNKRGLIPAEPLLIVGQQSVADPTRAPEGCHTLWIETHVPSSPRADAANEIEEPGWASAREPFLERVLSRLEDHAPGVRDRIVGTSVMTPPDLERADPNLVGGDVGGGSIALDQQLIFRPVPGWFRYRTPVKGLYLCSASAHPGGGVHGLVGRNCSRRVLRDARRLW
ncbi:MAG: NAD(P)/FAD-dependent oxidoreductase [Actinomycetota bacterium]